MEEEKNFEKDLMSNSDASESSDDEISFMSKK